ncbi:MAG: tetratricopeptide repeat protein [Verrucomicrobiia bacterium]
MKIQRFLVLAVVLAGLLAYHNSFVGPFVFDDVDSISENRTIRHLWPPWKALSPPHGRGSTVEGRPVLNFTFAVNYALGGTTPWGYHVVNLAIHILAGLTLYGIARRTLVQPTLGKRFAAEATSLALAIAVIWTVHPLQTEAVTYVAQRAESLMGLFYLLTLYCFLRGVESRQPGRWYALSVTACLLGMGTKEVMVSAPLIVLIYDWIFVAGSVRQAWRKRWRLYAGLAGTWLVLGYLVATTSTRGGSAGFESGLAWWQYALIQCRAIVHYLKLSVWSYPLVFDYWLPTVSHAGEILPYALVLAALATGTVIVLWRRPAVGFLGVWFFAILAPSSSVVPVATETISEHRMYLPLVAVVVLAVLGIYTLIGRRSLFVFFALAVGLGLMTWRRNQDYCSSIAIWDDTVAKCPQNPRAHHNLGFELSQIGKLQEAIGQYEQALRIEPDYAEAHHDLGLALSQIGKIQEAIGQYEQALLIEPDYAKARNNLGVALSQAGRFAEGIGQYEQALRIKPDYAEVHYNLATALEQTGRVPEAIQHYEQALRIMPEYAEAHYNLGNDFLREGKVSDAIAHYEQALRIKPDYAEAHSNLGIALAQTGKIKEAIAHYEQALRIKPDYPEAHSNLGSALEQAGRVPEAIQHYEQALRLRPDLPAARNALARLQGR